MQEDLHNYSTPPELSVMWKGRIQPCPVTHPSQVLTCSLLPSCCKTPWWQTAAPGHLQNPVERHLGHHHQTHGFMLLSWKEASQNPARTKEVKLQLHHHSASVQLKMLQYHQKHVDNFFKPPNTHILLNMWLIKYNKSILSLFLITYSSM